MTVHDVIVVGAGAGGSAAASLLARQGADVLLLDKSAPPRDTVRCDGVMPQGVYWLDRLGCAPEVLAEARGCIKACDLYLDGDHLLTGRFPDDTDYPDFALLVLRCRFNQILQTHAARSGARFEGGTMVRGLQRDGQGVRVLADAGGRAVEHRARVVIGADGPSSAVSRALGNNLKDGVLGLSVRTTYAGVRCEAGIRVYFNRDLFPSYGWMFIDEHQNACVGLGCAVDPRFPPADNLGPALRRFIDTDLESALQGARRIGPFSGGIAPHFRPDAMVADGVVLIGDAACQADPLNRGGIHTAIESAFYAAEACRLALEAGDFSLARLAHYETLWRAHSEPDWRASEIFMSLAKNPGLKDLALFLLRQVGMLGEADPRFGDFASGVFSGVMPQSSWLSARALYQAAPKDPGTWVTLLRENSASRSSALAGAVNLLAGAAASAARSGAGLARKPGASLSWALEVLTKTVTLADQRFAAPPARASLLQT